MPEIAVPFPTGKVNRTRIARYSRRRWCGTKTNDMENQTITKPKVRELARGEELTAKQMQAGEGELLPMHYGDVESIIFIHEGECILNLGGEDIHMKPGEARIIPPDVKHQFRAITDFKGIHFMPKKIKFKYFT